MLLWTEYTDQMNSLIEQIMPTGGFAWGTTWKFATYLDDYSFETMNMPGEDRLVRATIPLRCKATLLGEQELHKTTMQKQLSVKKVSFATPVTKFNVNVIDPPPDTPAPVTEYCVALLGDALKLNCEVPLNTCKSAFAKNAKGTVKLVCPPVAVYCIRGSVSEIVIAIIEVLFLCRQTTNRDTIHSEMVLTYAHSLLCGDYIFLQTHQTLCQQYYKFPFQVLNTLNKYLVLHDE